MAYKQDKSGEIIINGFEQGIADSPELGLGDIRSANITSVPGEVSVSFGMTPDLIPPTGQTSVAYSAVTGTNIVTVSSTTGYYNGMGVTLATSTLPPTIQALVVGGGGGGGTTGVATSDSGGGGGGGAVLFNGSMAITPGTYTVVVGAGGSNVVVGTTSRGGTGTLSSFNGLSSAGGGGGGSAGTNISQPGIDGGSGASGGGGAANVSTSPSGAAGAGGSATQGNTGAAGVINYGAARTVGGGGGGSGTAGSSGTINANGGAGGNGTSTTIAGNITATYGGGGGGAGNGSATAGTGGTGGGGTGNGTAGTTNSGGGGGGAASADSGAGGTGRVQIAYLTGSITATGGTITTNGAYTVHSFLTVTTTSFIVSAINPGVGNTYYMGNLTGTTFKLYYDLALTNPVVWLGNTTGNYSVPSFGTPVDKAYYQYYASTTSNPIYATFLLDNPGNCWYLTAQATTNTGGTVAAGSLQYTGNTGHATSGTDADFGIAAWNNYLFVIVGRTIDYISLGNLLGTAGPNPNASNWVYAWKTNLTYTLYQHQIVVGTDAALYICNATTVASIVQNGSSFDPTDTSTYSYTTDAMTLPFNDYAQSINNLGGDIPLLIGGVYNYVYTWDRKLLVPNSALICADSNIVRIVSTNGNAYVFAGSRGRIYITNGQQIQVYKKIPDSLSGDPEPYYTWQDALYYRNKLYFTMTAKKNDGTTLNTMGGVWVLGIDAGQTQIQLPTAGSLFNSNQFSYGTYGGSCPVLFYSLLPTPSGYGIGGAWVNSSTVGIDMSSSTPYTGGQTYVDTDIIPVGGFFSQKTFGQIEYKLSKPLVSGETVTLYQRKNLTDAFTLIGGNWQGTSTTSPLIGAVSDAKQADFQEVQWVQFRAVLTSTATNPSYVRMTQLTLR